MDVLANCRIYPLSNFLKPKRNAINLEGLNINNSNDITINNNESQSLHLIEHSFRKSKFKEQLVSNNFEHIIIIDIISIWQDDKFNVINSIYTFNELINFLTKFNDSPLATLSEYGISMDTVEGIMIDNLSYIGNLNNKSIVILIKILKLIQINFGCFILSTSYGLEYYEGIENFQRMKNLNLKYPTLLPMNYLLEMDTILLRETGEISRRLK
ncbi:hypothetical protein KAFR_0A06110 [Kazachstania africana CBS 2517]|uniref:Uncharacterized protein n=1 Tax=Kazachstania africana (strain ATCC 22294 / BCRC 22015 / CBS 2517 / CECT 1963 / NBRC 1671 / NRRL Y-8276) TaxID=1071382 RepID=H2ANU6_KAZAF|nr:hypothetical protein KAFR_0A06110 [Kazachstania africana CBS 2517]CCF56046.1 hypothetical protein KAFR_0A06110 [Kazachstania africana CBS 2517]